MSVRDVQASKRQWPPTAQFSKPGNLVQPVRGHGSQFGTKMEMAVAALLTEQSFAAAAGKVGISERALRSWTKTKEFAEAFKQARTKALSHALGRLQAVTVKAVAKLEKLIDGGDDKLALQASTAILGHTLKAVETLDQEERLTAIEAILAKKKDK